MISGSISDQITLVYKDEEKHKVCFTDVDEGIFYEGKMCFPSDAGSLKSARSWANNKGYEKVIDNKPFKVRIVDLDFRGNGGRAYKALVNLGGVNNLLIDLREDMIMDVIRNFGIGKNGECDAEFIFAKIVSQMKVIRVGSKIHQELLELKEIQAKSKIKITNYEIGCLYGNSMGRVENVYLGKKWTKDKNFKDILVCVFGEYYAHDKKIYRIKLIKSPSYKIEGDKIDVDADTEIRKYIIDSTQNFNVEVSLLSNNYRYSNRVEYILDLVQFVCLNDTKGYIHPEVVKVKDRLKV